MATDSAALDRRQRPTRRANRPDGPRIQSPAAPIAEGIGLDQPFFADKNRAFWLLQSIGWSGYFILRSLSGFANSMGWMFVVHTLLLTATGYSLTLLLATLFRRLIAMRRGEPVGIGGVIDQDAPDQMGGEGEEMGTAGPLETFLPIQAQIGLGVARAAAALIDWSAFEHRHPGAVLHGGHRRRAGPRGRTPAAGSHRRPAHHVWQRLRSRGRGD